MASNPRLGAITRPLQLIWLSIQLHYDALKEALRKDGLASSLKNIQRIRDAAIAKLFITHSANFIAYENTTIVPTLLRFAHGRILELGPGAGNQLQRFDASHITTIHGVEPNPHYASCIAAKLEKLGLRDRYELLTCGVEDSDVLRAAGVGEGGVDAVVCMQVLCAVRDVRSVVREVWRLLRPGGVFVFWEHVGSGDRGTAVAQACLNPAWSAFVGCSMTREIKADILDAGEWENPDDIEVGDDPYSVLPRIWGVLRKKA